MRKPTDNEELLIDLIVDWWHDHQPRFAGQRLAEALYLSEEEYSIWVEKCLIPEDWHLR